MNKIFVKCLMSLSVALSVISFIPGCISFNSATPNSDEEVKLFPIIQNFNYGYIDKSGKVVIKPQFKLASFFREGLAAVAVLDEQGSAKLGFIDESGNMVIKPEYIYVESFSKGLAKVAFPDQKVGFIDKTGKIVIDTEFSHGYFSDSENGKLNFNEGLTPVMVKQGGKYLWGFIDQTGAMIIEPQFSLASPFREGLAKVRFQNDRVGFIDKTAKIIIEPQFSGATNFHEGLAAVKLQVPEDPSEPGSRWVTIDQMGNRFVEKWGFIDKTGKVVIEPKFAEAESFSEGLAKVAVVGTEGEKQWGFIDSTGKIIIEPQFRDVTNFKNGLASVTYWDKTKSPSDSSTNESKSGFIDKTGKIVIEPKFLASCPNSLSDPCRVFYGDLALVLVDNNTLAYINKKGEIIWSSPYKQ